MDFPSNKPKKDFRIPNNIDALPFAELAESCLAVKSDLQSKVVEDWAEVHGIKHKTWVYPQVLAYIGKWTLSRNESGLISARQMLIDNCKTNLFSLGVYFFCMSPKRFINKQYTAENSHYCGMVPLILAAHRKMNDIAYSDWDPLEISKVVDAALYLSMTTEVPDYPIEALLQFRVHGLTVKTGDKAGSLRSAVSTWGLNGLPWEYEGLVGPGQLPQLTRMMICQTWCAHPDNRNKYMILDPNNWARMPEPLITSDPIASKKESTLDKMPWD